MFQDPYSSLNPRRDIASIVALPLEVHGIGTPSERRKAAIEMLRRVGLPARYADNTPGQLSGGQRQRVAIARALVMRPAIVICDEPTSALDVSVQAQILNLLMDLRREFHLTYVFISHNLAVVEHIATRSGSVCTSVRWSSRPIPINSFARRAIRTRRRCSRGVLTPEPGPRCPRHRTRSRVSRSAESAVGLPFPSALPAANEALQCDRSGARAVSSGAVACHLYPSARAGESRVNSIARKNMTRTAAINRAEQNFDSGEFKATLTPHRDSDREPESRARPELARYLGSGPGRLRGDGLSAAR